LVIAFNYQGFAFFEFLDPSLTDAVCDGLNGMELADKKLVVQRASSRRNVGSDEDSRGILSIMASSTAFSVPGTRATPSPVLVLYNMIIKSDFKYGVEVEEIRKEVELECGFFGNVEKVVITPPKDGSITDTGRVWRLRGVNPG
jgi:splicing factor U2AF subunit